MSARRFALASATAAILLLVVLTPLVSLVRAPAPPPFTTFGRAFQDTGVPANKGTPIRTFIDGVDYSNLTSVYAPDGSFYVDTFGNYQTPATPDIKEGGDIGDPIMYAASNLTGSIDAVFNETATWSVGGFLNRDLHLSYLPQMIPKIQSITTRPADGGNEYVYLCNPTPLPVDLSSLRLQRDAPGSFNGPSLAVGAGPIPGNGGRFYVDLGSPSWLTATGDALKLVWVNPGPGGPNGGANVVVDRVEFNVTTGGGTLYWEPGNTIMTDAPGPGLGQEIHRNMACADTNSGSDFVIGPETGRPAPPVIAITYPAATSDFTGGTRHRIDWNMTSAYPDNTLVVNVSYSLDGLTYVSITTGLTMTDPSSLPWDVPLRDTTIARAMVCARDLTGLLGCGRSAPFTIDSTRPTVQSTDPAPLQRGVALTSVITITFNEAMQPQPTDVTLTPAAGVLMFAWADPRTLEVRHGLFAGCQDYLVSIGTGFLDASLPGNALVPASVSFSTICAPTLVFQSPAGGEDFTGGSTQFVRWQMNDEQVFPQLATWVNLSTDGGVTFPIPIDGPTMRAKGPVAFPWTVNRLNTTTARIQVCVQDDTFLTTCDSSPANFRIDSTPPTVALVTPANGANQVLPDDPVRVTFSEPMNRTKVAITVSPAVSFTVAWNANSTVATLNHAPLSGGPFTVTVAASSSDVSNPGNPLGSDYVFTFSLDTAPGVVITEPVVAGCWCGGRGHQIGFSLQDAETAAANLVVYVNFTTAGGGGGPINVQRTGWAATNQFAWVAPAINDSGVRIIVTAIDPRGLSGSATSVPMRIDTARPRLQYVAPANNSQGVVADTAPIQLVFSEPMQKTATQSSIAISPALGGLTYTWDASGVFLNITHDAFEPGRTYTITLSAGAVDSCDPGNPLDPAPTIITFTVAANNAPNVAFTSPIGSGVSWNAGDSKVISWTMTDETPAAQLLVWLNATTPSGDIPLVTRQPGATTYTWAVPANLAGTSVSFHVDVVDPGGMKKGVRSVTVSIAGGGGGLISGDVLPWILVLVIVVVVVALLLFFLLRRRKKEPEEAPPAAKKEAPKKTAEAPAEEESAEEEPAEDEVSPEEMTPEEGTEET